MLGVAPKGKTASPFNKNYIKNLDTKGRPRPPIPYLFSWNKRGIAESNVLFSNLFFFLDSTEEFFNLKN